MLRERLITSLVGIALLLAIIWLGSDWFTLLVGLAAIIAGFEFYSLIYPQKSSPIISLGLALAFLLDTGPAIKVKALYFVVLLILLIPFLVINISENIKKRVFVHEKWTFLIAVSVTGFFLSYYTSLINIHQGRSWVILAIFTTFAADSGA